jgi:putative DNA methylase
MSGKRKLIEVALPLDAINRESAREKTIRHGHPSTFHLWWARRPLAACRAVLFASLVDDPSAHPELFPTEDSQLAERERLFKIIERLVRWDAAQDSTLLAETLTEIKRSCGDRLPTILDPFCGGGSIPLEAQRLGLDVLASDLNPVAALITKALIDIPGRFAGCPPVRPAGKAQLDLQAWRGAQGLAEDVRYYSRWIRGEAKQRIGQLYPSASVMGAGSSRGSAEVIAWIWARTVVCPNPACGSVMPLLNSMTLCSRRGREAWLEPVPARAQKRVEFKVRTGSGDPKQGSVTRGGATCLTCGTAVPLTTVRGLAQGGGLGSQLICTVAEGQRRRLYLEATEEQVAVSQVSRPANIPETEFPVSALGFRVQNYGITRHWQLFTDRQLVTMTTFVELVSEARTRILADGADDAYADAVTTYLALCVDRLANRCSSQCFWNPGRETVEQVFARNALPMIWVYSEANPFSNSTGNFLGQVEYLAEVLERVPARGTANVRQLDAAAPGAWDGPVLVCTDPPYYDNVPYADLSDFFYVWLRRCLAKIEPELFSTILVPKAQELIAEPARQGSWEAAATFFETGLRRAFENMLAVHDDAYPLTLFYAFKQAEDTGDGSGHASTGWETMLQGLLDAGAMITGTWPVRTEQPGGLREVGRAALASSIVLVCRRRPTSAPLGTRREFLAAMRAELPDALRRLQLGNIAPVDLAQASIGPGMAVFSRFARVVEADGSSMAVRAALGLINQALDEILAEQEGDLDPESRWAVAWFEECGTETGPFGKAETLSKAKDTAINALVQAGIVEARGNKVKLLDHRALPPGWDPITDPRLTVWEVTQHLIAALDSGGEEKAAALLRQVGALGDAARELAYRLYSICERKQWSKEALNYNGLIIAWPAIAAAASRAPVAHSIQQELL